MTPEALIAAVAEIKASLAKLGGRPGLEPVLFELDSLARCAASERPTVRARPPLDLETLDRLRAEFCLVVDEPAPPPVLRWRCGDHEGRLELLGRGAVHVGTEAGDVRIPPSAGWVSRFHARLVDQGDGWAVVDDSRNGTWIAGVRADPGRPVRVGRDDRIVLGDFDAGNPETAEMWLEAAEPRPCETAVDLTVGGPDGLSLGDDPVADVRAALEALGTPEERAASRYQAALDRIEALLRAREADLRAGLPRERAAVARLAAEESELLGRLKAMDGAVGRFLDRQLGELKEAARAENEGMYEGTLSHALAEEIHRLNPALRSGRGAFLFGRFLDPMDRSVEHLRDFVGRQVRRWSVERMRALAVAREAHVAELRAQARAIPGAQAAWVPDFDADPGRVLAELDHGARRRVVGPDMQEVLEMNPVGSVAKSSLSLLVSSSMIMLLSSRFFDAELAAMRDYIKQRPAIPLSLIAFGLVYYSMAFLKKRTKLAKEKIAKCFERLAETETEDAVDVLGERLKDHAALCRGAIGGVLDAHVRQRIEELKAQCLAAKECAKAAEDALKGLATYVLPRPTGEPAARPSVLAERRAARAARA